MLFRGSLKVVKGLRGFEGFGLRGLVKDLRFRDLGEEFRVFRGFRVATEWWTKRGLKEAF